MLPCMPKIVDRDQYRQELLMKSFDLFAQKGYSSITMRQLAQGIGVSTGTLYHYFPSKEALFLQLTEELERQNILHFLAEAGNPPTLKERIESIFQFVAKHEEHIGKQTLLWIDFNQHNEWSSSSVKEKLKEIDEQTILELTKYMQITDRAIVDLIFNLLYGLMLRRLFGEETISYTEQGALVSKMLANYMAEET